MKVVLASKNRHKLEEISKITQKFDMELVLQSELGVDIDVEENGTTFEENSFIKAEAVMKATGLPALADDSGIAVTGEGIPFRSSREGNCMATATLDRKSTRLNSSHC